MTLLLGIIAVLISNIIGIIAGIEILVVKKRGTKIMVVIATLVVALLMSVVFWKGVENEEWQKTKVLLYEISDGEYLEQDEAGRTYYSINPKETNHIRAGKKIKIEVRELSKGETQPYLIRHYKRHFFGGDDEVYCFYLPKSIQE